MKRVVAVLLALVALAGVAGTAQADDLPAAYRVPLVVPMYNQGQTPGCSVFSTTTAMSALSDGSRFHARAIYRAIDPAMDRGVYNEDVLSYLQTHAVTDSRGIAWHVSTWAETALDVASVKADLLRHHVLVADLMLSGRFDDQPNPIRVPPHWLQAFMSGPHSMAVIGYNSNGFILQNSYGKQHHHPHSVYVITYHYWRKYALDVYAFDLVKGVPTAMLDTEARRVL